VQDKLTSRRNAKVKRARALQQRKYRRRYGQYLVEGIYHVGEAAAAGALERLFYAPELLTSSFAQELIEEQAARGIPCHPTSEGVFEALAGKSNPQGIIGVAGVDTAELTELAPSTLPWGVVLAEPQDPGNVGSIMRTIDAVGASGLILLGNNVDPYHPRCVRASMGTLFWYPVVEAGFDAFRSWALEHNYHIYGTSANAERDYRTVGTYEQPALLLLGSEREGLSPEHADLCSDMLRIPMRGRTSSLNLSIAAALMLYAMLESFE
jgi:TrmH family RNA methyltransferase